MARNRTRSSGNKGAGGSSSTNAGTGTTSGNDSSGNDSSGTSVSAVLRMTGRNVSGIRNVPILLAAAVVASAPHVTAQEPSDGSSVLARYGCVVCHSADGRGTAAGPSIAASDLSLPDFIASVRQPMRTMPAYNAQAVPDEDLTRLFAYLEAQTREASAAGRTDVGAKLYSAYGCYSCHADEAQGGMHGPRLGPDPITYARFAWYVRHPTRTMPPYSPVVVSDRDIADIYAFVEAQPAPPPLSSIPLLAP